MPNFQKNTVELIGAYGGDLTHALSAWTSTNRDLTDEKRDRIPGLLKYLAENGHETPFEKSSLHFLVKTDIATHIHLLKHRIGVSINGESARYKELTEDNCYLPPELADDEEYGVFITGAYDYYHEALLHYEKKVGRDRAKDLARFFLPYANQIDADIMFNFRSFIHFLRLRKDDNAQDEVHELAESMLDLVFHNGDFDNSLRAFGY